jgi:hypothetical protein
VLHNVFEVMKSIINNKYPSGVSIKGSSNTEVSCIPTTDVVHESRNLLKLN